MEDIMKKTINEYGLRIQYSNFKRSKGPGGQSVNKTANAYKARVEVQDLPDQLTQLFPQGILVESSSGKSTKANKQLCLMKINKLIARKIAEKEVAVIDERRHDVNYFRSKAQSEQGTIITEKLQKAKDRRLADKRKTKQRKQNRSICEDSVSFL